MPYKTKQPRKTASMPLALTMGLGASWVVTLVLAIIATFLISGERAGEGFLPSLAVAAIMVSSFAGAMISAGKIAKRRMIVCLASGGIYYASLVCCNILIFDGAFQGMIPALLSILGCCLLAGAMGMRQKKRKFKGLHRPYKR